MHLSVKIVAININIVIFVFNILLLLATEKKWFSF